MNKKLMIYGVLLVAVIGAGLFLWDQYLRFPIREFTIYDPPVVLNDFIEGKTFSEIDRTDPLSTRASFYLITTMDEKLSLYTDKELSTGLTERVLRMDKNWLDPEFRNIAKRISLVFSFKYVGRYGPPEWHMVYKSVDDRYSWSGCVYEDGEWYMRSSGDSEKSRKFIYELVESMGFYNAQEIDQDDISEFRKKLNGIDRVLAEQEERRVKRRDI